MDWSAGLDSRCRMLWWGLWRLNIDCDVVHGTSLATVSCSRTTTSWPTKAALLWPHQVKEMQHPRISARGTRRRQGSVEFDMCHWSEESRSSSWTSNKWSPCSKTRSGCGHSSWTCLSSLWQNLCFGLRSPQSSSCPLMTVRQIIASVQHHRRNRRTNKQASKR